MRILILGVGDAFTRRHFGSSALVHTQAGYVLIDCPDLIHRALHDATSRAGWSIDVSGIDDIILTHLHGDHCNGLESFGFYRRILRLQDPSRVLPRLHTSKQAAERLWERLAPAMQSGPAGVRKPTTLDDYFEVHILDPSRPSSIAGLEVQCRYTNHSIPTIGIVLTDGPRPRPRGFGWSADTPFEQAHVDWLNHANVFVHESNLGTSHTPIEALNDLPEAIRKKIRLIHLPDDFDPKRTDIKILREGDVIDPTHS